MFHLLIESFNQFPFAILSTLYFISFPLIYYKITINTTHFEIYDFFGLVIWTTLKKIIIYRYLMTNFDVLCLRVIYLSSFCQGQNA